MKSRLIILSVLVLLAFGCGVGRNFKSENIRKFSLEKTRIQYLFDIFGDPWKIRAEVSPNLRSHIYTWHYSTIKKLRELTVESVKGKIRSYIFISSFSKDATDFKVKRISQIKTNVSTEKQVLNIMGEPHGRVTLPSHLLSVKPSMRRQAKSAWLYLYRRYSHKKYNFFKNTRTYYFTIRSLVVYFDANKVAIDYFYYESIPEQW